MVSQGGGKLGANQYLPGATKKAGGKGHTGYVYGGAGEGGGLWKVLLGNTYIGPGKPGIRVDKSWSPASLVRTLWEEQET